VWWYVGDTTSVVIVVLVPMLLQKMGLWKLPEQEMCCAYSDQTYMNDAEMQCKKR